MSLSIGEFALFFVLAFCFLFGIITLLSRPRYERIKKKLRKSIGKRIVYHEQVPLNWGCCEKKECIVLDSFSWESYLAFELSEGKVNRVELNASMIQKIVKVKDLTDEDLCFLLTSSHTLSRTFAKLVKSKKIKPNWAKDLDLLAFVEEGFRIVWE